ncbi:anthranilate synthase component II [Microbacterium sp. ASV49]|uniref:Gamma-glutamyl-gamma-aminobutyrate hydrolase family protein n=1 Tax=Microbacterium candidum TaxID=3041922 RepID=A0ABT7MUD9_9MICO|nr:gamma-glutamyl-gamma-aminobutyrate hydrolase family protein [Microbacterium sp. ASV49]MDL9978062.1 gamma-glutamyl-gamma-aminobutyrate hydrolase family protein [Microbacterium sp. ASV49]
MTRILVVDNHDSFVHTLVDYVRELGAGVTLTEADEIDATALPGAFTGFDGILVSPGPGTPADAGASIPVVRAAAAARVALLGVCLGHQAIAEAFGARVDHAPELMHGMVSLVHHDGEGVFAGLPDPFEAGRYHSLAVVPGTLTDELVVTARTDSGVIMGIRHRDAPVEGVQFHPESVLTEGGYRLLGNWLEGTGLRGAAERGAGLHPRRA